jgi:hypothetical protein
MPCSDNKRPLPAANSGISDPIPGYLVSMLKEFRALSEIYRENSQFPRKRLRKMPIE